MAKFLLDGQALDDLANKLQQLQELFGVIQSENSITMRACVKCDIGSDIAESAAIELGELRSVSRAEVSA
ncbi:hypothetical protein [Burkholderia pseudomallei]|uniref:hypothetical protein n=1 Tax=Burkholderia pseudomallei TaxID=28450 RepID=UPI000F29B57D|nr:hypothetical protein [Burkholderia pseudomallei]CAJ5782946.1 Uncharacterised protein [Burkholderia pseudomallei]CAJ6080093.1 Uncharacterised protein [Burkholderia pseudomallei]CAJ8728067.1 Uncharacterised protein [Burkholderia pseudomallei]VBD95009.1 Uncharacterised protein [Burkholderia pseudomallei]VBJ44509.1 Uncharacterised protein [Burkholderia pseudomallei]